MVRTLCPWREHLLRAAVTAELSSPCCIPPPGGGEWTGDERREGKVVLIRGGTQVGEPRRAAGCTRTLQQ